MDLESNAAQHPDMQRDARRALVQQLARRITPERRPSGRVRALLAATWILALVCGGTAASLVTLFVVTPSFRQLVVDTALALGAGTSIENAQVTGLRCERPSYGGRLRMVETACTLTVMQDGARLRLELHGAGEIARDDIRGLRSLGGTPGAVWSSGVMFGRWLNVVPFLFVLALTAAISGHAARGLPRQHRHLRILRDGVLHEIDLLRHRVADRLRVDLAFDHQGERRRLTRGVDGTTLVLDGMVTRGLALVTPGGDAEPLLAGAAPLDMPEEDRAWLAAQVQALTAVYRPPAPTLAALAGAMQAGAARDYVAGFSALWHATDAAGVAAAQALRDAAAAELDPERIDALLARCREAAASR